MYWPKLLTVVFCSTFACFLLYLVVGGSLIAWLILGWILSGPVLLAILLIEHRKNSARPVVQHSKPTNMVSEAARKTP